MVRYEAFRLVSLQTYFKVFVTVGAVVAAVGVITYFTGTSGQMRFPIIQGRERPYLTFSDPNNFATYLAGIIPLGFAMVVNNKEKFWIWFFALAVLTGCLILAVSRAAWLGTAGGIIITVLIMRKKAIFPLMLFIIIILVEVLIFVQDVRNQGTMTGLGTVASVKQTKGELSLSQAEISAIQPKTAKNGPEGYDDLVVFKRGTDSYRVTLIKIALAMLRENPVFGVGLGNSGKVMGRYFNKIGGVSLPFYVDYEQKNIEMTPHITLLHIASEVGLPGAIVFVILVFGFYYVMMRGLLVAKNQNENFILMAGLVGAWTSMLITTSFGWIFVRCTAELFFVLTGLAVASAGVVYFRTTASLS
jgi:O-antigen ligase